MPRIHQLKTDQLSFRPLSSKHKTAELRYNDRNYWPGDILILEEINSIPEIKTGAWLGMLITHTLTAAESYGALKSDFVLLSTHLLYRSLPETPIPLDLEFIVRSAQVLAQELQLYNIRDLVYT